MSNLSNMPPNRKGCVIKCECGHEIPVIPDAKAVGSEIDSHIEEHRRKQKTKAAAEKAAKRVHDHLFTELFDKIAEE
jgi:hypothetical protein